MLTPLTTTCPNCSQVLRVDGTLIGQKARCAACGERFLISTVAFPEDPGKLPSHEAQAVHEDTNSSGESVVEARPETAIAQEPTIGKIGRFELKAIIGRGGFGNVYRAFDPILDREVAVKTPRFAGADKRYIKRFIVEAKAAARLRHPNIVAVFESGQTDGKYYIASEFVRGVRLADLIKQNRRPAFRKAAQWVQALAEALAYAHSEHVIHRDIKPENILIDQHGRPQLMDFGLAKRLDVDSSLTADKSVLGTPAYMSPEQARGELDTVGPPSDQYSLGVVLYELLTGKKPFEGPPHVVVSKVATEDPPRPRSVSPTIPTDLEAICLKAMEKDAGRRYPTTADFAADLQRWLNGEPIIARSIGLLARFSRWCRRNPTVASLTATVAAVLILGTVVFSDLYFALQASNEARRRLTQKQLADARSEEAAREVKRTDDNANEAAPEAKRANDKTDEARANLYVANIRLAATEWEAAHIENVNAALDATRPKAGEKDVRAWEWNYLWNQIHSELLTLNGYPQGSGGVAFSPDGKRLATESDSQTVKVWNAMSGQEILTLKGHTGWISSVAFSADGKRLASASSDGTVKVWDATSGQEAFTLKGHTGFVLSVAFSAVGNRLASADDHQTVKLWDATSGQETLTLKGQDGGGRSVAFSPDGKRVALACGDQTVKVWDATSGQKTLTLKGHTTGWVRSVAFSPDGKWLASASEDKTVKMWDATTGKETLTLKGHTLEVISVAFSPDGKRLASGSVDQTVKMWDVTSGAETFALKGHTGFVWGVAFSPDGKRLATASGDGTTKVWDSTSGQETLTLRGHTSYVESVAFSPDGKRLASAGADWTVKVWDVTSGQDTLTLNGHTKTVYSVAFSPDGKRLASTSEDKTVKVWDSTTGQDTLTLNGHTKTVYSVAFSPDGKRLASASEDKTVKVWNLTSGQATLTLNGHTHLVKSVAFSPDGKRLASASHDQTVKVWDATSGQETLTLRHSGSGYGMAFSPDGKRLASAGVREVKIWDATSGQEMLTLKGHTYVVNSVAFSPDGKRLASAGGYSDQMVKVWDTTTGHEMLTLKWHTQPVKSVAFSADGKRLASAGEDGIVKVWDGRPESESPDRAIEREARRALALHRANATRRDELAIALRNDPTLTAPARELALTWVTTLPLNFNDR